MTVIATPAFITFAKPAADKCARAREEVLFLSYNYVEISTEKELRWVLNVVQRSQFPGTPAMIVNGWEIFYQPEMAERLVGATLDFKHNRIIVHQG
jgi:hypothetical protein